VQFHKDQHKAVIEYAAVSGVQCIRACAGAQLFEHVVEAGQCQTRMFGNNAHSVRIKVFSDGADALPLEIGC